MRIAMRTLTGAVAALVVVLLVPTPIGAANASEATASVARPAIVRWPIPFGPKRKREMAAYSERHYGTYQWRLRQPKVIVEHVAVTGSVAGVYNTFAPDVPDVELHELPNVCSHYVIGSSGRIFQLVNLRTRCRHTVGLNWTAIGIEHAGYADSDVLGNPRQLQASLRLTQYLRCHFGIPVHDVIGHAESLSSPYHHELVPSLRTQTHGDWVHSSMRVYRRALRRLGPC
ncbi:MAG TPA: peptidoglycan recognition family protein [Solirubrobacterales bacterium]|nr:peptidoglycan recognition family protein [Solirubrobacterales bacterium]